MPRRRSHEKVFCFFVLTMTIVLTGIHVNADHSGEITILTKTDLPQMGEEISIRARIDNIAIILGQGLGLTVIELERYQMPAKIQQL